MKKVKIIIPLYREFLSEREAFLIRHNLDVLSNQEVAFILPEGISTDRLQEQIAIDQYEVIRVSDEWLGVRCGISGYNRMMMSEAFYKMFLDSEYILICQSDVYIFRDELEEWCSRGYDYIGAPWPRKSVYDNKIMKMYLSVRRKFHRSRRGFMRQDLFGKVGNGGLSLRRVESHIEALQRHGDTAKKMLEGDHHRYNEDVFWGLVPESFRYPSYYEAMRFSVDLKPSMCMDRLGGVLPFGCHGLTRDKIWDFWCHYIK